MFGNFFKWLNILVFRKLSNKQILVIGAILIGITSGLITVLLKYGVHKVQFLIQGKLSNLLIIIAPFVGLILVTIIVKLFFTSYNRGSAFVLFAIAKKHSIIHWKETILHPITSFLTIGFGGSSGLESPIVQTCSAVGSVYGTKFPINYRDRTLFLSCGAAAGIAAAFNAPIAGVLFALEVLLVDVSITAFIPLLISAAAGALMSKIFLTDDIILNFKGIKEFNYGNTIFYASLGITCGILSIYYSRLTLAIENLFSKIKSSYVKLLIGGVCLTILLFLLPPLFGEGYSFITQLTTSNQSKIINESIFGNFVNNEPLFYTCAIFILCIIKVLAVSFTIQAGGNGGNFAPSLFVGACIGYSFSTFLNYFNFGPVPVSNFCLVAMAGMLTGIFHSPLTAIFLIAEVTGGYELMIPLMIVSALSTSVSSYFSKKSLDEIKLQKIDSKLTFNRDTYLLSDFNLITIIEKDFIVVKKDEPLSSLINAISKSKRNIFPVIDNDEKLIGIVRLEDIREIMFDTSLYEKVLIEKYMQKTDILIYDNEDMNSIMEKFDKSGLWNIPVVDKNNFYKGFVSKSSILSKYRSRLKNNE